MGLGESLELTPAYDGHYFKSAIKNAQTRIDELLAGQNSLNEDTKVKVDDLQKQITDLVETENVDIEEVQKKLQILADIFSKDGDVNDVFDALVTLASAWNNGGDMTQSIEGVFDSQTGTLDIDLSSFNFGSKDDYKLVGSADELGALRCAIGYTKIDEKTAQIKAYDRACFVEDEVLFDASENSFGISIIISYARPHLSFSITDEDGNETKID